MICLRHNDWRFDPMKITITLAALIILSLGLSTAVPRSSVAQDDPLRNVVIAPTDWSSLQSAPTKQADCGLRASASLPGGLPKSQTTAEAATLNSNSCPGFSKPLALSRVSSQTPSAALLELKTCGRKLTVDDLTVVEEYAGSQTRREVSTAPDGLSGL